MSGLSLSVCWCLCSVDPKCVVGETSGVFCVCDCVKISARWAGLFDGCQQGFE